MSAYDPDESTARADLCRFLSACYYEPAPEFAEEKLFDNMLIAATRLRPDLSEYARKLGLAFAQSSLDELLVDYTRLFLGPLEALAKPYGASWLKQTIHSEDNPHLAVIDIYNAGGFEIDEGFQELPDHIAVELEFLYMLIFNGNQAVQSNDLETKAEIEELKQRFLSENLGAWIAPFGAVVTKNAQTRFYSILAEFTECFVRFESSNVVMH